jgi:Holliday junction resolvase-like predicted endonuclease
VTDPRHELGLLAEEACASWLTRIGWSVLERRWRSGTGELDLICRDPTGVLVGVEVKLRRTPRAGSAAESLDRRRVARLRLTLASYAAVAGPVASELRLDLVTVTPSEAERWRLARFPGVDVW